MQRQNLAQISHYLIVYFSSDIFLAKSSLGKSMRYCICNSYNLGNVDTLRQSEMHSKNCNYNLLLLLLLL